MNRLISALVFLTIALALFTSISCDAPQAQDDKKDKAAGSTKLYFKWTLAVKLDPGGRDEVLNMVDRSLDATVTSGDKLKIYVEPAEGTHLYLFLLDSSGRLQPIFSSATAFKEQTPAGAPRKRYIPLGKLWFTFDEVKGTETFYLIASADRLNSLEQAAKDYLESGNKGNEALKDKVPGEIKKAKRKYIRFTTLAEKPVTVAGTLRGLTLDIADLAVEVEASNFYSKTIRIEHR